MVKRQKKDTDFEPTKSDPEVAGAVGWEFVIPQRADRREKQDSRIAMYFGLYAIRRNPRIRPSRALAGSSTDLHRMSLWKASFCAFPGAKGKLHIYEPRQGIANPRLTWADHDRFHFMTYESNKSMHSHTGSLIFSMA